MRVRGPATPFVVTPLIIVVCAAACSETAAPPSVQQSPLVQASAASLSVANATVHVVAALQNMTVSALNDSDEVVGDSVGGMPFRWTQKGGLQRLNIKAMTGSFAVPSSVNDNGVIAGFMSTGDSTYNHAVAWLPDGSVHIFPLPADSTLFVGAPDDCGVEGINIYGQMVGICTINDGETTPAVFEWHGPTNDNPPGFPSGTVLSSISDDGWIGGGPFPGTGTGKAFLVSPSGQVIPLQSHDSTSNQMFQSGVNAVTRHGWAAGVDFEDGCPQAVAWLSAPGQSFPEFRLGTCGQAVGITDDWYVVGTGTDVAADVSSRFAFVWFPGVGLQRLPGLGGTGETSMAFAINANHHVLGQIQSGNTVHTVIWYVAARSESEAQLEALLAKMPR
jgi:hypothetical protein